MPVVGSVSRSIQSTSRVAVSGKKTGMLLKSSSKMPSTPYSLRQMALSFTLVAANSPSPLFPLTYLGCLVVCFAIQFFSGLQGLLSV